MVSNVNLHPYNVDSGAMETEEEAAAAAEDGEESDAEVRRCKHICKLHPGSKAPCFRSST